MFISPSKHLGDLLNHVKKEILKKVYYSQSKAMVKCKIKEMGMVAMLGVLETVGVEIFEKKFLNVDWHVQGSNLM